MFSYVACAVSEAFLLVTQRHAACALSKVGGIRKSICYQKQKRRSLFQNLNFVAPVKKPSNTCQLEKLALNEDDDDYEDDNDSWFSSNCRFCDSISVTITTRCTLVIQCDIISEQGKLLYLHYVRDSFMEGLH